MGAVEAGLVAATITAFAGAESESAWWPLPAPGKKPKVPGVSTQAGRKEKTGQEAEALMSEDKRSKKRAAASILTEDWPLNLGVPSLLGRMGG